METASRTIADRKHWLTPFISGAIGLVAGLTLSWFESEASENRFFLEKQATTADRVALEFSRYVDSWRKMIQLRQYVGSQRPTTEQQEQLKTFVAVRDEARQKLFSALDASHLYFRDETASVVSEFKSWDDAQSTKTLRQLPPIAEWESRERLLLVTMREELMQ